VGKDSREGQIKRGEEASREGENAAMRSELEQQRGSGSEERGQAVRTGGLGRRTAIREAEGRVLESRQGVGSGEGMKSAFLLCIATQ